MTREDARMISDILKILSIKSFTHDLNGIRRCQDFLIELATKMGFNATMHANDKVVIIEPVNMTGRAKIGIVVHIDTVPFDVKNWKHKPLGEMSDSIIYGRGVVDDKGPTIIAIHALFNLIEKLKSPWQMIIGSSEEDVWEDMEAFLAEKPILPEFLVTIDGDGVQNGCRGYADITLSFTRETESKHIRDFYVPNGMNNTLPAKCIANIDGDDVVGFGREVHSSIPEYGKSAITDLARFISWNYDLAFEEFSKMFNFLLQVNFTSEESVIGLDVMKSEDGVGTSISVTNAKMKDVSTIELNLNVRLGPGRCREDVEKACKYLEQKYGCVAVIQKCILPSFVDPKQDEFKAMCEAYEEVIGKKPNVAIAKGLGYNAALPNCAIFGPRFDVEHDNEVDTCHQADECRSIENLLKFYKMLKSFLEKTLM